MEPNRPYVALGPIFLDVGWGWLGGRVNATQQTVCRLGTDFRGYGVGMVEWPSRLKLAEPTSAEGRFSQIRLGGSWVAGPLGRNRTDVHWRPIFAD